MVCTHRNARVTHCPIQIKLGFYEKQLHVLLKDQTQELPLQESITYSITVHAAASKLFQVQSHKNHINLHSTSMLKQQSNNKRNRSYSLKCSKQ